MMLGACASKQGYCFASRLTVRLATAQILSSAVSELVRPVFFSSFFLSVCTTALLNWPAVRATGLRGAGGPGFFLRGMAMPVSQTGWR